MKPFDVRAIPFSRGGSWLVFSWIKANDGFRKLPEGLYFRTVRDRGPYQQLFRIEIPEKQSEEIAATATAGSMRLFLNSAAKNNYIEVCFPDIHSARFVGHRASMTLSSIPGSELSYAIPRGENSWIVNMLGAGLRFMLTLLRGTMSVDAPWQPQGSAPMQFNIVPDESGQFDFVIQEYLQYAEARRDRPSFREEARQAEAEFESFSSRFDDYARSDSSPKENPSATSLETEELARYVLWSAIVHPEGEIKRPTIFATKDRLTGVWSWDHCFTALALCRADPSFAWDQMMTILEHQDVFGALPDAVFDRRVVYNFVKPPVHGWAIGRMLKSGSLSHENKEEAYDHLVRWTEFWFKYRDYDGDGIPQYDHGNDSGWDNASPFATRPPLEAPDLATYLVIQMETIAALAEELGKPDAAQKWHRRAGHFLSLAQRHLHHDVGMDFIVSGTHTSITHASLLPYVQLLLGPKLSDSSRRALLQSLQNEKFITEWGIATESPLSRNYQSDGYWRGPIWAPSTLIMIDALKNAVSPDLSRSLAAKYLSLVETQGFAENFDALTGKALRDSGFAWTAAVYLILRNEA